MLTRFARPAARRTVRWTIGGALARRGERTQDLRDRGWRRRRRPNGSRALRQAGRSLAAALVAATLATAALAAEEPHCPPALQAATRLLLVTTPDFPAPSGTARLYRRTAPGSAWRSDNEAQPASVGRRGVGWAFDQTEHAAADEPIKREGDKRAPAGVFAAGRPFGTDARGLARYLDLNTQRAACVDDLTSRSYGAVVPADTLPAGTSFEPMWQIALYRQGIILAHTADRTQRGGSCIFLHVARSPGAPTVGCVAMAERDVRQVQSAFDGAPSAVAILPAPALARYGSCLPR